MDDIKDIWVPIQDNFDTIKFEIKRSLCSKYILVNFKAMDSPELRREIRRKIKFTEDILDYKLHANNTIPLTWLGETIDGLVTKQIIFTPHSHLG